MNWPSFQRTLLGLVLIAGIAFLLLLSDLNSRSAAPRQIASPDTSKPRRLTLIQIVEAPTIRSVREGMIAGLSESGLFEGRDYTLIVRDAQGDISMLANLTDAALVDQADMILTITTPALQTVMQRVRDRPVVFALALDPLLIGDTGTHENHRANVAGIFDRSPFEAVMQIVRECAPQAKVIGSLYNPAESNSVAFRDDLVATAEKAGLRCITLPVSSPAEVADAAAALCQRGIDVFTQINDNLHDASFPGIAQAARRARIPLFTFSSEHVRNGQAILAVANDHYDAGREAGEIAARVLRGENPANVPYRHSSRTRMTVNPDLARDYGVTLPAQVIARADETISQ